MNNFSKKDRIVALIKQYSNGKNADFARRLGVSPQTISTWLSRDTFDIELIFAKCENISLDWLLTGKGNILREEPTPSQLPSPSPSLEALIETNLNLSRTLQNLSETLENITKQKT